MSCLPTPVAVLAHAHTSSPSRAERGRRKPMRNGRWRTIWQEGFAHSASGALFGSRGGEGESSAAFGAACAHQTLLIEHTVRQSWSGNIFLCRNMREFLK